MDINPYAPPKTESLVRKDRSRAVDEELNLPQPHQFVLGALITAMSESTRSNNRVDASEICQMVLQLAYDLNAGKPIDALLQLGITKSEDVGKAIFELEDMGYGHASEGDTPADFDLLFDLTKPQHTWKVSWSTEIIDQLVRTMKSAEVCELAFPQFWHLRACWWIALSCIHANQAMIADCRSESYNA